MPAPLAALRDSLEYCGSCELQNLKQENGHELKMEARQKQGEHTE